MPTVSILRCGELADEIFNQNKSLKALGATSHGVFLYSARGVIFLSFDAYLSPLTAALERFSPELRAITPGEAFEITPSALVHPTITVLRDKADIWSCDRPHGPSNQAAVRMQLLQQAAELAALKKRTTGFASLLMPFLCDQTPLPDGIIIYAHILNVYTALLEEKLDLACQAALPLIGLGNGLTPSGDDFLVGLLLFINRWPGLIALSPSQVQEFSISLLKTAAGRTTSLSLSLLGLAAQGSGDERLVKAVDRLASSPSWDPTWVDELLTYGSSSGADALLGMGAAIRTYPGLQLK